MIRFRRLFLTRYFVQVVQQRSSHVDFTKSVTSTVEDLRGNPETLFSSGAVAFTPAVSRESKELRDALKGFQQLGVERSVLKLSFRTLLPSRLLMPRS